MTLPGGPLARIALPEVSTLLQKTPSERSQISQVPVSMLPSSIGVEQGQTIRASEGIGIDLTISVMTGREGRRSAIETTAIPTTRREAREVLHLISPDRTGGKVKTYDIAALKQIAKNIGIASSGNKAQLANNIRRAVEETFAGDT